jgi:hypothetical protein
VVLDECLSSAIAQNLDFPDADWHGWQHYRDEHQGGKLICSDMRAMPSRVRALVQELSAPPFLDFLQALTGIDALIPDPYLEGGGLHMSGPGATLTPHTDFHVYTRFGPLPAPRRPVVSQRWMGVARRRRARALRLQFRLLGPVVEHRSGVGADGGVPHLTTGHLTASRRRSPRTGNPNLGSKVRPER